MLNKKGHDSKRERFPTRPIFIIGNFLFAIFLAIFVSSIDSLDVRGSQFSIYANPGDGSTVEQVDANGNPVHGDSSVILRVATETPELADNGLLTPAESMTPILTVEATDGNGTNASGQDPAGVATATAIVCLPPPASWFPYVVRRGDRLGDIALKVGSSVQNLQRMNCLPTTGINYGIVIYVPLDLQTMSNENGGNVTPFSVFCEASPADWLPYVVQPGDNAFRISRGSGISVQELVTFNCLVSESVLSAGQVILLPAFSTFLGGTGVEPTVTPQPTATDVPTNTPLPTETLTPTPVDTATPTATLTPTPVDTATPTATLTPAPVDTATPTETLTPVPVDTATPTETLTPVPADTATPTETLTPVPADTATPTETLTPVPVDTATPTLTPVPVDTATPTETLTPVPVDTATPTETLTPVPVDTATPTPLPADTATPTETSTPSVEADTSSFI